MEDTDILAKLWELQATAYQTFQRKLMPTVDPEAVIGVRTPALRTLAKTLAGSQEAESFLKALPHTYYEENNLHSFLLEGLGDFEQAIAAVDAFLPFVDNWATCDGLCPRVFGRRREELLPHIRRWLSSEHVYTARFGLNMLLRFYLDEYFCEEYLELAAGVQGEDYYVCMMVAWYFATALAKQYPAAVAYLEQGRLARWTHNKAIQKAIESRRVSEEQKAYLRTLRRK